jgi:hypothetical protein
MFANNMALADAALEEALTLICNNNDLLSTDQCNILLATRGK